ncbi:MAG: hypothetical protein HY744_27550 [Deltaproteobacteria bacterium]|nr:hypothetical protein [Deltaproteobacteria bacterium]
MWLFTSFGFFSVVQKPGEEGLTVRARVRSDLERPREQYLPGLREIRARRGALVRRGCRGVSPARGWRQITPASPTRRRPRAGQ